MISPAHLNDARDSSHASFMRNRDGYRGNRTDADVRAVSPSANNRIEATIASSFIRMTSPRPAG